MQAGLAHSNHWQIGKTQSDLDNHLKASLAAGQGKINWGNSTYIILFHRLQIIVGKTEEGCIPGKVLFWALFIAFLLEIVLKLVQKSSRKKCKKWG